MRQPPANPTGLLALLSIVPALVGLLVVASAPGRVWSEDRPRSVYRDSAEPGPPCRLEVLSSERGPSSLRVELRAIVTTGAPGYSAPRVTVRPGSGVALVDGPSSWVGEDPRELWLELLEGTGGTFEIELRVDSALGGVFRRIRSFFLGRYEVPRVGETLARVADPSEDGEPVHIPKGSGINGSTILVTGQVLYRDRPFDFDGFDGSLSNRPVRHADVLVLEDIGGPHENAPVLGLGSTDASGNFSIRLQGAGPFNLFICCLTDSFQADLTDPRVSRVRVREQARNAAYVVTSATFPGVDADLDIGALVAPQIEVEGRLGNPFNIFDQGIASVLYLTGPVLAQEKPNFLLSFHWPQPNVESRTLGRTVLVGKDDGYDDCVILHEVGAIFLREYSNENEPPVPHGFGETDQDPRLSLAQGFDTFFAASVRQAEGEATPGIYVATDGMAMQPQVTLHCRLEDAHPFEGSRGDASEVGVFCALWDLVDDTTTDDVSPGVDDDPFDGSLDLGGIPPGRVVWDLFAGPIARAAEPTVADLWDGWHGPVSPGHPEAIASVFRTWEMRYEEDGAEPNNSSDTATPLDPGNGFSGPRTLYSTVGADPAPGTGDEDYHSFAVAGRALVTLNTRYESGLPPRTMVDPFLTLLDRDGTTVLATADGGGGGRNAEIQFQITRPGTYFARVTASSVEPFRRYGTYEIAGVVVPNNQPPSLDVQVGLDRRVSLVVSDPDGLPDLVGPSFSITADGREVLPLLQSRNLLRVRDRTPTGATVLIDIPVPAGQQVEICGSGRDRSGAQAGDCEQL